MIIIIIAAACVISIARHLTDMGEHKEEEFEITCCAIDYRGAFVMSFRTCGRTECDVWSFFSFLFLKSFHISDIRLILQLPC